MVILRYYRAACGVISAFDDDPMEHQPFQPEFGAGTGSPGGKSEADWFMMAAADPWCRCREKGA